MTGAFFAWWQPLQLLFSITDNNITTPDSLVHLEKCTFSYLGKFRFYCWIHQLKNLSPLQRKYPTNNHKLFQQDLGQEVWHQVDRRIWRLSIREDKTNVHRLWDEVGRVSSPFLIDWCSICSLWLVHTFSTAQSSEPFVVLAF